MTVRMAVAVTALYATRRYYRNWGTTKEECRLALPGDEFTHQPSVRSTEGISIDAPVQAVWPWLTRIARKHGGLFGHIAGRDGFATDPQGQPPSPGDVVAVAPVGWVGRRGGLVMTVARVVNDDNMVLRGAPPGFPWQAVWSFHLFARGDDRCRLLVRTRAELRHPGEVMLVEMAGPLVALATRRLLRTIKCAAEHQVASASTSSKPATRQS